MKFLIAHRILKKQHSSEAEPKHGPEVLEGEHEMATRITEQIRKTFRRHSSLFGTFKKDDNTYGHLAQLVRNYSDEGESSATFRKMSIDVTQRLKTEMEDAPLSTGGIVVFARFEHEEDEYLLIALVNENKVPWFDENMKLKENQSIDLDKLRHGVRINLGTHLDPDESGVAIMHGGRTKDADYFSKFVDFVAREDLNEISRTLLDELDKFAAKEDLDDGVVSELFERVHSYIAGQLHSREKVTLRGIANAANPDNPDPLHDHLSREDSELPGEFSALSREQTKGMLRFHENYEGLTLGFDRTKWAQNVKAEGDGEERFIVIRDAPVRIWTKLKNKHDQEDMAEE